MSVNATLSGHRSYTSEPYSRATQSRQKRSLDQSPPDEQLLIETVKPGASKAGGNG